MVQWLKRNRLLHQRCWVRFHGFFHHVKEVKHIGLSNYWTKVSPDLFFDGIRKKKTLISPFLVKICMRGTLRTESFKCLSM
jgi:hypothetical protein